MQKDTKFELSLFEELLRVDLHPTMIEQVLAEKETAAKLKTEIKREALRIIREFKNVMCRGYDEQHLERYIQMHQRGAIELLDHLQDYADEISQSIEQGKSQRNLNSDAVYAAMAAVLKMILDYIENEQSKYFNLNQPVPGSYRLISAELLRQNGLVLMAKLKSRSIDPALQQLILVYLSEYCALKTCTYHQQIYAKLLVEYLIALLGRDEAEDWNRRLMIELIYLNFNSSRFFTYCRRSIAGLIDEQKTIALQKEKFWWFIKELKHLHIKPNVGYKAGRSSLSELLLAYVGLEVSHIEELQGQMARVAPVQNFKERAEKFDFKLPLSLSVPQLALFAQLFMDVGVFIVEKGQIMMVMKFFAEHVTTIGTDGISADNLNKLRKRAEAKVCGTVEGILTEMLVVLRQGYMVGGVK